MMMGLYGRWLAFYRQYLLCDCYDDFRATKEDHNGACLEAGCPCTVFRACPKDPPYVKSPWKHCSTCRHKQSSHDLDSTTRYDQK